MLSDLDERQKGARKKLDIPAGRAMPCVKQTLIPTTQAPTQKVQRQKKAVGDPSSIERMATLSDKKRLGTGSVRISKMYSSQRENSFA